MKSALIVISSAADVGVAKSSAMATPATVMYISIARCVPKNQVISSSHPWNLGQPARPCTGVRTV